MRSHDFNNVQNQIPASEEIKARAKAGYNFCLLSSNYNAHEIIKIKKAMFVDA